MNKRMFHRLAVSAAVLLALVAAVEGAVAQTPASSSCRFFGTATLDGTPVAGGTRITAVIYGDRYHTHTPLGSGSSTYSITIRSPQGKQYPDGAKVAFEINGYPAEQASGFQPGASYHLDLSASTASGPWPVPSSTSRSSTNVWLIVGLVLGFLAAAALAYYLVLLRRVLRRRSRRWK